MGICVACFVRDIAGLGLHRAAVANICGRKLSALFSVHFCSPCLKNLPRLGSAPIVRFILGVFAMIGALVFLGCPWRALFALQARLKCYLRAARPTRRYLIGTMFLRNGYNLGRAYKTHAAAGWVFPLVMVGFLLLLIIDLQSRGEAGDSLLFYSVEGPGSMHAPLILSLIIGLVVGFLAQKSRFCTMGAIRDLILFRQTHLFLGLLGLVIAAFITNLILNQFNPGFAGQPVAHTMHFWNFAGMTLAGLAFALAGGCPGRQLFLAGEGDGDAAIFAIGMIVGAAFAHNLGLASSASGATPGGIVAVIIGMVVWQLAHHGEK